MRLAGEDASLELTSLGYEFPDSDDEDDGNWLVVHLRAKTGGREWTATDPSLQTVEVEALARWLEAVADGEERWDSWGGIEPNLEFEVVGRAGATTHLRVWVEGELRPSWAPYDSWDERDLGLDFELSRADLHAAAAALRSILDDFPIRGAAPLPPSPRRPPLP